MGAIVQIAWEGSADGGELATCLAAGCDWVLISLVLTTESVAVLLVHMPKVGSRADVARGADDAVVLGLGGDLADPGLGLAVLLVVRVLNVYKPRGLTPYGQRQQVEHRRRHAGAASRSGDAT